jgi:hypothetical protein
MLVLVYLALLFVALTPGVLLRIPPGGSKLVVAAVHGVVLALVWQCTHKVLEGFASGAGASCTTSSDCASENCTNNKCM